MIIFSVARDTWECGTVSSLLKIIEKRERKDRKKWIIFSVARDLCSEKAAPCPTGSQRQKMHRDIMHWIKLPLLRPFSVRFHFFSNHFHDFSTHRPDGRSVKGCIPGNRFLSSAKPLNKSNSSFVHCRTTSFSIFFNSIDKIPLQESISCAENPRLYLEGMIRQSGP